MQEKRTFSLPVALSSYIDELVESGAYASGSEVVRAGLRSLQERHDAIERWHEYIATGPETLHIERARIMPPREIFEAMQAHLLDDIKKSA